MPFKQVFERRVNRNMREGEPGPGPDEEAREEADVKSDPDSKTFEHEEEDIELSEKKDRPPRFSTLFTQPAPPQIVERYVEPKRRSGVTLPTPLFVILAIVLFFESTLLFAYTIIGLYNNVPQGVLPFGPGSTATVDSCNCGGGQAGINISPNFILPGGNAETVTVTADTSTVLEKTTTSTSTSSSSSSSSSSTSSSIDPTAVAAGLASFLRGQAASNSSPGPRVAETTKVVTSTPEQKTVLLTSDVTIIPGQSTSTSTVKVPPKSSSNAKRASPASKEASEADSGKTTVAGPTPSTLMTAASPPATTEAPEKGEDDGKDAKAKESTTQKTGVACFGGSGAVMLNCVSA
ncbi:uncharacterized protein LTR77_002055 [Saxophila tyrrhenica]|uniref:Uncharacterized protein n=1 Tax=Saxophila tyrrhenica TaxID=1690608 RepID=A0AAV9PI07_9PEZI|nr:hypothetical protein LTR77_002055 [Saxophila tyrrhenica]